MTDITELALIAKIKKQTENFDTVVLKEWEALALVEALEKAQGMEAYWKTQCRGITDHCEELQARIAELESRTVKIPYLPDDCDRIEAHFKYQVAINAAGIKVEAD
ncbi:hypothetical protein RZP29_23720 [Klebsiella quasipneumoniae subsp. similipneumoniae]|uniref:Ead/Ea22-like family protein n=1 Tax=Klebsiella quasipneumoniae subsp. similipneumoniae TaxID=1463164 RepID=A0AAE4MV10_9ENTR|nr:hypothetical protein [Klebsiella quasipneumoniae]MDV0613517.1 hypothetical protein [Klebsiella quasipneumoniae subsp. similipneumoniae]MDV0641280.1 hypothetical protein [Klebsiella quasipneumoniae subsp. similipneumoniae]MDV0728469.1 hypothetical protein [Klebsiella quasipneumoniae subsp. similipneumoniae]MDV0739899.1 hypothetical protein [Klebsiella quasipneumoniae subsp. similipneumoniae]MDV0765772.1 hypothetical protein [Klebsiella quasipneumoniae subsp. similipneumoniae]